MKNKAVPVLSEMFPELRKGKWTQEEEDYANKIITYFNMGLVRVQQGVTLRSFLSEKLRCDPMRITKKFSGTDCIGKQVFSGLTPVHDCKTIRKCETELKKLERVFINRLVNKSKERSRNAQKRNSNFETDGDLSIGKANTSTSTSSSQWHASTAASFASIGAMTKGATSTAMSASKSDLPLQNLQKFGSRNGGYKRISSAPDLLSLEQFEREGISGGVDGAHLDSSGQMRKKRRLGVAPSAIPRARSMLSFDSFAEIDDRAAGELLLSFSETLRDNFAALQRNIAGVTGSEGGQDISAAPRLAALPAFFSSEATSTEAAKYTQSSKASERAASGTGVGARADSKVASISTQHSATAKFLESLSMLHSGGTAASLFPEMSSLATANNAHNSNFSVLEERVPFSSDDTRPISVTSNFDDSVDGLEVAGGGQDTSFQSVGNDIFDEPSFFIGSGADIE